MWNISRHHPLDFPYTKETIGGVLATNIHLLIKAFQNC